MASQRIDYFLFSCNLSIMFSCPPCTSKALPREFRSTAEALFPQKGFPEGKGPSIKSMKAFANLLGIGEDYSRLQESGQAGEKLLNRFQNNLDLLIQKTWVEKADEGRKEKLLDSVPPFITLIEEKNYPRALKEFGAILQELAYLFFGVQSQKDDFSEYALRIDPQMGLFWWYGGQINVERSWFNNVDDSLIHDLLLLGICYLTNF